MNPDELQHIVNAARGFLEAQITDAMNAEPQLWAEHLATPPSHILDLHLVPDLGREGIDLNEILSRLLQAVVSKRDGRNVIEKIIVGGWPTLRGWMHDFNPEYILNTWGTHDIIFNFFQVLRNDGQIRGDFNNGAHSYWPHFSKSIVSAAGFLSKFPNAQSFLEWSDTFVGHQNTTPALPLVISEEVFGIGIAHAYPVNAYTYYG